MDISAIATTATASSQDGLDPSIRNAKTPAEQCKAAAGQFEAILLRQFLNESVSSMMGGDDSPQGSIYGYLLTDVLANKLSQGSGMGLSKIIEQQLTPRGAPDSVDTRLRRRPRLAPKANS